MYLTGVLMTDNRRPAGASGRPAHGVICRYPTGAEDRPGYDAGSSPVIRPDLHGRSGAGQGLR